VRYALVSMLLACFSVAIGAEESMGPTELRDRVLSINPRLRSARLGVDEASGRLKAAKSAGLPTLSMELRSSYFANPSDGIVISAGEFGSLPLGTSTLSLPSTDVTVQDPQDPFYYYGAFSIDQSIWTWGKTESAVKLREKERELASVSALNAELSALTSLYKDLYSLSYQREALALARTQSELSRKMVASIAVSRDAGITTELDYQEARLNAEKADRSAAALEDSIRYLEDDIRAMADLDPGVSISTEALAQPPSLRELTLGRWQAQAEEENLDLRSAALAVELRGLSETLARQGAAGRPDLGANVKFGWAGSRLPGEDDWGDKGDWFLTATVAAKGTLLDFGKTSGSLAEASAAAKRASFDYARSRSQVSTAVSSSIARLETLWGDLDYAERTASFQDGKVHSAEAEREAGGVGDVDVLKAQIDRLSAVLDLSSARMRYSDACISLLALADPSQLRSGSAFAGKP